MLIQLATLPAVTGAFYMYFRDKYEKEPINMAVKAFINGIVSTYIIYALGRTLEILIPHNETPFFTSFISSSFVEEFVKFVILYCTIWRNKNFNEPLDGIVYAVFLSLGFAWIENLVYVFHPYMGGISTGITRAIISVPSHGLFGVHMGYYFAKAKFENEKKYLWLSFFIPYIVHGVYNYCLLGYDNWLWLPFCILQLFLWLYAHKFIKKLLKLSPFQ